MKFSDWLIVALFLGLLFTGMYFYSRNVDRMVANYPQSLTK